MTSARRFTWACVAGGVPACVVFALVALGPRRAPFEAGVLTNFYDAQARAWLHGRWDVPWSVVIFERFNVNEKFYMYFGPWPALLRLPVVALTDRFDGRLSRVSMLGAFVVYLGFCGRLLWQARGVLRGAGAPMGWRGSLAAAGFVFLAGCGSGVLFLGSVPWVHHEAALWGVAWATTSFSCLVSYFLRGRFLALAWASLAAMLALLSRPSIGVGPVLALGVVALVSAVQVTRNWVRRWRTPWRPAWSAPSLGAAAVGAGRRIPVVLGAAVAPVMAYAYVNHAKFGTFLNVPIDRQDLQLTRPERQAALAATGDSLFGIRYLPTNVLAYARPDGIGLRATFPWVTFGPPPRIIGGVIYDSVEAMSSVTITSISLGLLVVIGLFVAAFPNHRRRSGAASDVTEPSHRREGEMTAAVFRIPVIGALGGAAGTLVIADLYERYKSDFAPVLVIGSALGLMWLAVVGASRAGLRRVGAVILIMLGAWSCWSAVSLAIVYQYNFDSFTPPTNRAEFLDFQLDVDDALRLGRPGVERGPVLPVLPVRDGVVEEQSRTTVAHSTLFVVNDCDGLYVSTGRAWLPIEVRLPGQAQWLVRFDRGEPGTRTPLWSAGGNGDEIVWARWVDRAHVRLEYESRVGTDSGSVISVPFRARPNREYRFDVRRDALGRLEIAREGAIPEALTGIAPLISVASAQTGRVGKPRLGAQPNAALGETRFDGAARQISLTPNCDRLTR